jgi:hypothetical protein
LLSLANRVAALAVVSAAIAASCAYDWPPATDGDAGDAGVCVTYDSSGACKSDQVQSGAQCCCHAGLPVPASTSCPAGKSRQDFNGDGCFDCLCVDDAAPPRLFTGSCTQLGGTMFDNNGDGCKESCWCDGGVPACATNLGEAQRVSSGCYVSCP